MDLNKSKLFQSGDIPPFDDVYRDFQGPVYRYCLGILKDPTDAQDATANTMVRIWKGMGSFKNIKHLRNWAFKTETFLENVIDVTTSLDPDQSK